MDHEGGRGSDIVGGRRNHEKKGDKDNIFYYIIIKIVGAPLVGARNDEMHEYS